MTIHPIRPIGPTQTLQDLCERVDRGFAKVTGEIAELVPRVAKLERDASWRARIILAGKVLAPFLAGLLAHYVPGVSAQLPALLEALGKL